MEPSNVFETVANLEDEAAIRNIVAKHCAAAVKAVKRELTDAISNFKAETENEPAGTDFEDMKADNAIDGGHKEAEILLKRVQRLCVVDNQKIYALLRNGMADINRSIRESERHAMRAAVAGDSARLGRTQKNSDEWRAA